jgi:hypothetical protein
MLNNEVLYQFDEKNIIFLISYVEVCNNYTCNYTYLL